MKSEDFFICSARKALKTIANYPPISFISLLQKENRFTHLRCAAKYHYQVFNSRALATRDQSTCLLITVNYQWNWLKSLIIFFSRLFHYFNWKTFIFHNRKSEMKILWGILFIYISDWIKKHSNRVSLFINFLTEPVLLNLFVVFVYFWAIKFVLPWSL